MASMAGVNQSEKSDAWPEQSDGDQARRDEREKDRDPGEDLALRGAARGQEAPVLGRQDLRAAAECGIRFRFRRGLASSHLHPSARAREASDLSRPTFAAS